MSIFDMRPKSDEIFKEFFMRSHAEISKTTGANFWLVRKYGKRMSFIAGERSNPFRNTDEAHLLGDFYLFFNEKTKPELIGKISEFYKKHIGVLPT